MRSKDKLPLASPLAILSLLVAAAIIFIGVRFLMAPLAGAEGYGVPVPSSEADAYLLAKGVRDIASGIFVLCLVAAASRKVVGIFMLAAALIPIGDALIILARIGPVPGPLAIHGGTALFMLGLAYFLLRDRASRTAGASRFS